MADDPRGPAPEQIRLQDIRNEIEKSFPGCKVDCQHGAACHSAEIKLWEYELRVLLSGPLGEQHKKINVRFIQRIERNKMRVLFDRATTDWYELLDSIGEARALVKGIIHALSSALNPKTPRKCDSVQDIFFGD